MTYDEIKTLVEENNRSKDFSVEFICCLIWKESNFNPALKNAKSTASGLMQITKGAVIQVNSCTPKGVHFEHDEMFDAAKNVQCGTYYLDIAKNKLGGIDTAYGTGKGYSKSIIACEISLKNDAVHPMAAFHKIHK